MIASRQQYLRAGFAFFLAFVITFPLLYLLFASFKPAGEIFSEQLLPSRLTLENFRYVLTEVPFWRYLGNSFFIATTITVVALWFHSMAGYALARLQFRGRETLFVGILLTLLVSIPVILVPLFVLVRELGMVNSYAGLIIPVTFHAFGIFWLRQYYLGLPKELEDAADVDGCGYWKRYLYLILPLSKPVLAAQGVFFFLVNWNSFLWPLTITRDPDLWVVQIAIASFRDQYSSAWNYILAASVLAAIPTLLLFMVFQRQLVESLKQSGMK
jgi:multiple sugar transport system permease protein